MDPLCEDYYSENPYGYCGNNPVNYVDPNGLMKVLYNPDGTYKETTVKDIMPFVFDEAELNAK